MPQAYIEGVDEIHATDPRGRATLLGISAQQVSGRQQPLQDTRRHADPHQPIPRRRSNACRRGRFSLQ
ncbi:protein of unknown function [Ralstonia solanacearum CMR15]|nr:protein of unknown function [Ralstonia solanacearum CMR15]